MQAAFTIKEVRELMKLSDVAFHPAERSLIPEDLKALPRGPRRLMEVILKGTALTPEAASKSWSLDFCLNPKAFGPSAGTPERVGFTEFEKTSLSSPFDRDAYVSGSGETGNIPSSVVFRSIGYKSVALQEFSDLGIPFDDRRGIVRNDGRGRVAHEVRGQDAALDYAPFPGLYCAGWVKRGPTGVIASTMEDAFSTADAITQDWTARAPFLRHGAKDVEPSGWEGVKTDGRLDEARVVHWKDWHRIDEVEKQRGREAGKEREKFTSTANMLAVLG
jgi:adrenodoxin-NADP+ reductase